MVTKACVLRVGHRRVSCLSRVSTVSNAISLCHGLKLPSDYPAGPLSPLALTGSHDVLRRDYTFQSDDDVKGYWAHLEQICCTSAR